MPGGPVAEGIQGLDRIDNFSSGGAQSGIERDARLGEADLPGRALKQRQTKPALEGSDGLAHRRGTYAQFAGRFSEALMLGDEEEGP